MAAQLSHPHIVPVYRADDIGGFAFFAMGYVDGETLGDRIRDRGTLPPAEVVRVLREVAWALTYAHARGIVHRDIKPENILLERGSGRAIVTDFGIARADFNPALTQDGYVLGTVHYMSPEQASGEPLDGLSDFYSLGCVGFLALSGRLPFEGTSPQAILLAHATKDAPALRSIAPDVPPALATVIDRCLRKTPSERLPAAEFFDALNRATAAIENTPSESSASAMIASRDAMAVWRRAAELQAEAAARLEARLRTTDDTRQLVSSSADDSPRVPTDAYRVRDIEAAAAEAGISQRYVALALAELNAAPNAAAMVHSVPAWKERLSTRLFGTAQRTLSVSRVFRHPPRVVLQALGRTLQAAPFSLSLRDTFGGHPLDGGVLVFDLPAATIDPGYRWSWTRYGAYIKEVRMTIGTIAGDPKQCEVTITVDLRDGLSANLAASMGISGGGGAVGGVVGAIIAKKAFAMIGAALFGPAVGGAMLMGLGILSCCGPVYRWELAKATAELDAALAAVDTAIRSTDIFGDPTSTKSLLQ